MGLARGGVDVKRFDAPEKIRTAAAATDIVHPPPGDASPYPSTLSELAVATGMARGATSIAWAGAQTTASRPPSPPLNVRPNGKISTRPLKDVVRKLPPDHPLRVVILSEPEEIDGNEYFVKLTVWLRLLPNDG